MLNPLQLRRFFFLFLLKNNDAKRGSILCFLVVCFVAITFSCAHAENYGVLKGHQLLYVNSPAIHEGGMLYETPEETGKAIEKYPNGTGMLLLDSQGGEWAHVEVHGLMGEIRGYMKTSELTPLDGSYGTYPFGKDCMLISGNYVFQTSMPSDIEAAFSDSQWEEYHSVLGSIASEGCDIAVVILKKDSTNLLCLLKNDGSRWVIDQVCRDALYAGNELPEHVGFASASERLLFSYPPSKDGYSETFDFILNDHNKGFHLDRYVYGAEDERVTEVNKFNVIVAYFDFQDGYLQIIQQINSVESIRKIALTEVQFAIESFDVKAFIDLVFDGSERPF